MATSHFKNLVVYYRIKLD